MALRCHACVGHHVHVYDPCIRTSCTCMQSHAYMYEHPCKLGNGFQCIWGAGVLSGSVGVGEGGGYRVFVRCSLLKCC